jgi:hypothetical protein
MPGIRTGIGIGQILKLNVNLTDNILTEDGLFYFATEDGLYLRQEYEKTILTEDGLSILMLENNNYFIQETILN